MKNKQGLFHLLTILSIPVILATIFLAENYWLGGFLFILYGILVMWLLKNTNEK
jgi:hypothetical protein